MNMDRRLRRIEAQPHFWSRWWRTGSVHRIVEGIPETAEFVMAYYHAPTHTFSWIIRDASFEEVPEGNIIPMLNIVIRDIE